MKFSERLTSPQSNDRKELMTKKSLKSDPDQAATFITDVVIPLNPSDPAADPTDQQGQALVRFRNLLKYRIGCDVRNDDLKHCARSASLACLYEKMLEMRRTQPHYSIAELGTIKAPTFVMAGEFDCVKRQHTDQLAKAIPGAKEVILKGATHVAPLFQPDLVNAQILKFLE
jgi:pimeloyl-ACP methyl ester carboxylesterase